MARFARFLVNSVAYLGWLQVAVVAIALVVLVASIFYAVFMRYLLHSPPAWSIEVPSFMLMVFSALGLSYTQKQRGHVRVDMLVTRLPPRGRAIFDLIAYVLFLVYGAILFRAGWFNVAEFVGVHKVSMDVHIPLVFIGVLVPIGIGALCLQLLVDIGQTIPRLYKRQ